MTSKRFLTSPASSTALTSSIALVLCLSVTDRCTASSPLISLQSPSVKRILQVGQELGLEDPLAAIGLDSAATLSTLDAFINTDATCGASVHLDQGNPHLVICLKLRDRNTFVEALTQLAGAAPTQDSNNIYRIGGKSPMFAKQSGEYILLSDEGRFLIEAAELVTSKDWSHTPHHDVQLTANLSQLLPKDKATLIHELTTTFVLAPTTEIALNLDSVSEHLRSAMQLYMIQSLADCWSLQVSADVTKSGAIHIVIQTAEDVGKIRTTSSFSLPESAHSNLAFDFTTQIPGQTRQIVKAWARNWEADMLRTVEGDHVQDPADGEAGKSIIRCLAALLNQCADANQLDCFLASGERDGTSYLSGALAVQDGKQLAMLARQALEAGNKFGLRFSDLQQLPGGSGQADLDVAIELPEVADLGGLRLVPDDKSQGNAASPALLHIQIQNNACSISLGNEGERLRQLAVQNAKAPSDPLTLTCNLGAGELSPRESSTLPFGMRQMKLKTQFTEVGRTFEILLEKQPPQLTPVKVSQR